VIAHSRPLAFRQPRPFRFQPVRDGYFRAFGLESLCSGEAEPRAPPVTRAHFPVNSHRLPSPIVIAEVVTISRVVTISISAEALGAIAATLPDGREAVAPMARAATR
jgi:hypothetical protein